MLQAGLPTEVRHVHQHIGVGPGTGDFRLHGLVQSVTWLQQAGRVHEDGLVMLIRVDAQEPLSRRLCLVSDDTESLADQVIEQRGFPDVRQADNGAHAGSEGFRIDGMRRLSHAEEAVGPRAAPQAPSRSHG